MSETSIIISKTENIGILTLNRPEFNNTFNVSLAQGSIFMI
jgi:enoyl-CoA hydratase/carnithine racemase